MTDWKRLRGKTVAVLADGVEYRGTVVELGLESLVLRGAAGMREIPWDRIGRVAEVPPAAPRLRSG